MALPTFETDEWRSLWSVAVFLVDSLAAWRAWISVMVWEGLKGLLSLTATKEIGRLKSSFDKYRFIVKKLSKRSFFVKKLCVLTLSFWQKKSHQKRVSRHAPIWHLLTTHLPMDICCLDILTRPDICWFTGVQRTRKNSSKVVVDWTVFNSWFGVKELWFWWEILMKNWARLLASTSQNQRIHTNFTLISVFNNRFSF